MRRWASAAAWAAALSVAGLPAVQAQTPAYDWTPVAIQQPPATMHPGMTVALTVALRNEGTQTWFADGAGPAPVRLGTSSPRDRSSAFAGQDPSWLWSSGKRIRMTTPVVPPGGVGTFTFTFRAPEQPAYPVTLAERFLPLVEPGGWMEGRPEIVLTTIVRPASGAAPAIPPGPGVPQPPALPTPPAGYSWEPVLVPPAPATMHPGAKTVLSVWLRNTGSVAWDADNFTATPVRLAAVNDVGVQPRERASAFGREDPTWLWSGGRRIRMITPRVEPGAIGAFEFTFSAPAVPPYPRNYIERFAPIVETVGLLDDKLITFATQVRPAAGPVPAVPEVPGTEPLPIPTLTPPPVPTDPPLPTPVPTPAPTLPSTPGTECATTMAPRIQHLWPPAAALSYSPSGTLLTGTIGASQAVTYGLGKLFVADTANDRIVRTDLAGFSADVFGSAGSGEGQMRWPGGIAISDSGIVFVADTGNHRIQQWGFSGLYLGTFGFQGAAPGQFSSPRGIAFIANGPLQGLLAIADTGNDRVQIISRTGVPVAVIGGPGAEPGKLSSPTGVSVWGDEIFVADTGNNRIQKFAVDGRFLGSFGGEGEGDGCTMLPTGILASQYGVFVTESGSGRVDQFTRWGLHLRTVGGLATPSAVAMDGSAKLYVTRTGSAGLVRLNPLASAQPPSVCQETDPIECVT
ncbi:MAG TPA: NHL repeat-containing protein [Actinomycetota bacterium]|nr:NHL repeat-containing protein [Actinomycetota bacterium]